MLTVSQLKKKLQGIKGSTPIYIADHDHGRYEHNSPAGHVELLNQKYADPWEVPDMEFIIEGDYIIIKP